MTTHAAALREALADGELSDDAREALGNLLAMFEPHAGDDPAAAQARKGSTLRCTNCAFTWPGFFLPMDMGGRGPLATIRLAICPRCYGDRVVMQQDLPAAAGGSA